MPPPCYPSDLSDAEWELLEPLLSSNEKSGRSPKWPLSTFPEVGYEKRYEMVDLSESIWHLSVAPCFEENSKVVCSRAKKTCG
jgi:hypothetical protein